MNCEFNIFEILQIDVSVTDRDVIGQQLEKKRAEWTRKAGRSDKQAQKNLERLGEIKDVLGDPNTLRAHADAQRKRMQAQADQRKSELRNCIALLRKCDGICTPADLATLQARFGDIRAAQIKCWVQEAGVRFVDEHKREQMATLPAEDATKIATYLAQLGQDSLYAFLALRPSEEPTRLVARAKEIDQDLRRRGKTDADSSARQKLARLCRKVLADDTKKSAYDNHLAFRVMERFVPQIELAANDGVITRAELDELIRQTREQGVDPRIARAYIDTWARRHGRLVQQSDRLAAEALPQCGFCGRLASPQAQHCAQCGQPMHLDCPRCGITNPSSDAACSQCGCRVADAPVVHELIAASEAHTRDGDLVAALGCIDKALGYWPDWQRLTKARGRIEHMQRAQEQQVAAIAALVRTAKLQQAQAALQRLVRTGRATGIESVARRIDAGIARAREAFTRGEAHRRNRDHVRARTCYAAALEACADFAPAQAVLAAAPPPAPPALTATALASGWRLRWQAPPGEKGLGYRVVRKAGGCPRTPADGTVVGETKGTALDDVDVPIGEPCYYAVYTACGSVLSNQASTTGPHLRMAEVTDVEAIAGEDDVRLRWQPPRKATRVSVWRCSGRAPARAADGIEVAVVNHRVHDSGLAPGQLYGYRLVAWFPDPTGKRQELCTEGVTITAITTAPPAAVTDLCAERRGQEVTLRWTPVADAEVQIRQTDRPPAYAPGVALGVAQSAGFGRLVSALSEQEARARLNHPKSFFVPISIAGSTAVVGRAVTVVDVDPVRALAAERTDQGILLTWQWPADIDQVRVCYAYDDYPEGPETGMSAQVTRRAYEHSHGWLLRRADDCCHYLAVFARASAADLFSPAARALVSSSKQACVSYQVRVKRSRLRRRITDAWVELRVNHEHANLRLPGLVLVGQKRRVPVSPHQGDILEETAQLAFTGHKARIAVPQQHWGRALYVKLFFKDAETAGGIRLLPASAPRLLLA